MNVSEKDIDAIEKDNSATQCYQAFGNSIVVSVICALMSQLNIDGVKPWNEMTDEERYELVYKDCFLNKDIDYKPYEFLRGVSQRIISTKPNR